MPVVGLAILADEEEGWRPTEFSYNLWGTKQSYQFTAVKLLDYPEIDLEKSTNPFAVVTLAHLHAKRTKHRMEDRYREKRRLVYKLYEHGFSKQHVIDLFRFIDWVLHLPRVLDDKLRVEIVTFEESQKMPYISSVELSGMQKGKAEMLTHLLQCRFGVVPEWASEKVAKAESPSLENWSLRIFDAQSLDDVFSDKT